MTVVKVRELKEQNRIPNRTGKRPKGEGTSGHEVTALGGVPPFFKEKHIGHNLKRNQRNQGGVRSRFGERGGTSREKKYY